MNSANPVRVAVMSPHPVVLAGLEAFIGENPDRLELVAPPSVSNDHDAEVVIYDAISLLHGKTDDLEDVLLHTARHVLILSDRMRPELTCRALQMGAQAAIPIDVNPDGLLAAIHAAMAIEDADDAASDVGVGLSPAQVLQDATGVALSVRELSTLSYIARGLSNHEIAEQEFLSINSVKTYIRTAYRKIGVKSRSQAVAWAIRHGVEQLAVPADDHDHATHDGRAEDRVPQ